MIKGLELQKVINEWFLIQVMTYIQITYGYSFWKGRLQNFISKIQNAKSYSFFANVSIAHYPLCARLPEYLETRGVFSMPWCTQNLLLTSLLLNGNYENETEIKCSEECTVSVHDDED